MTQNNIGTFIQLSRKNKGLTQKELGDEIGVSDKTISKWENGNSIPDTAMLAPLCHSLDISVNELLSGEKLPPENYTEKAEENMMQLLQENQKNKKATLLTYLAGVLLLVFAFCIGYLGQVWDNTLFNYFDLPSLLLPTCMCFAAALLSGKRGKKELIPLLRKIVLPIGAICSLLALVHFLHMYVDTPAMIGPILAVCVISILYCLVAYVILVILEQHLGNA